MAPSPHPRQPEPPPTRLPRTGAPHRSRWSESRGFGAALLLALSLITGTLWWQHLQSADRLRAETLEQARLRASQLTSASSAMMNMLFHSIDLTLGDLADDYLQAGTRHFAEHAAKVGARLPKNAVRQIALIAPDGYLSFTTLPSTERVYLGDREHFKVHLEGHEGLFISKPVLGRVSREWSIQFSRAVVDQGRLAGVLVMSLSPDYLQDVMAQVTLGSDDSIAVLRQSGELLARNRDLAGTLGKSASPQRPYMQAGAAASGEFDAHSDVDGVHRLIRWQRLEGYPVTVLLGLSTGTALLPAERAIAQERRQATAASALLWLAAALLALVARRMNADHRRSEELEFVAMNDTLTGIHSRHALMDHLERAVSRAERSGGRVGLLYIDLDAFKPVNDRFGHAAGDEVLKAMARRIEACLRASDLAARLGGDEFVVVVEPLESDAALTGIAERIGQALAQPLDLHGVEVRVGASIGRASFPEDATDADGLLAHADRGMYSHKAQDRQAAGSQAD